MEKEIVHIHQVVTRLPELRFAEPVEWCICEGEQWMGLKVKRPRVAKGNKTYYLLKRSESVLNIVECGFLTNPEEAGLLCKEEYQNKIVEAIVKGIEQYLKQQKI